MMAPDREALYYPFHLCHERTLARLLESYARVHFRDHMAMRLSRLSGTIGTTDRMGDAHPELLQAGRIVQGYSVSGPLGAELIVMIDRDIADPVWRTLFHDGLRTDRRFQRGLFDPAHGMLIGSRLVPGPAALLQVLDDRRQEEEVSVAGLQRFENRRLSAEEGYQYEYASAVVKTAAALAYTVRLCGKHGLEAVTDSQPHFLLLEQTRTRERLPVTNQWLQREGY